MDRHGNYILEQKQNFRDNNGNSGNTLLTARKFGSII